MNHSGHVHLRRLFTAFPGNRYNVEVMNPVAATPEAGGVTLGTVSPIAQTNVGCDLDWTNETEVSITILALHLVAVG